MSCQTCDGQPTRGDMAYAHRVDSVAFTMGHLGMERPPDHDRTERAAYDLGYAHRPPAPSRRRRRR